MHWLGIILTFGIFLLSIGIVRSFLRQCFPNLNDTVLDIALIVVFIIGSVITTANYLLDQEEIKGLQNQVDMSRYQDIAEYNAIGNKSGKIGNMPFVLTPINDWNEKYCHYREGEISCNCNEDFINLCQSVIQKMPLYPFSYFFLSQCLKEKNDSSWLEYAMKAKSILEKTTQLPNHRTYHDKVLQQINTMLNLH